MFAAGRDWDATWKNQWPVESEVPEFKASMLDFFQVPLIQIYIERQLIHARSAATTCMHKS